METNFDYFDAILFKESKKRKKEIIEYIELNNLNPSEATLWLGKGAERHSENQSLLNSELNNSNILSDNLIKIITRKDFLCFITGLVIVMIFLTLLYLYLYDKV